MAESILKEKSDVIRSAVERVIDVLRPMKRDQVLPWAAVESLAGFDRLSPHWSTFRHRLLRDFRKETGIVLWPVRALGWKLLTVEEQLSWRSRQRRRRAARQLHRDEVELLSIPDDQLNKNQQVERAIRAQRARQQMLSVRRSNKVEDGFGQSRRATRPVPAGKSIG